MKDKQWTPAARSEAERLVKDDGGSAFPQIETNPATTAEHAGDSGQEYAHVYSSGGMSLRDWFAGQAVIALGAHRAVGARGIQWLAEHAYMVADSMLKAREQ